MLTPVQLGAALRDLAEFTWAYLDTQDDAAQVQRASVVPTTLEWTTAGWRAGERPMLCRTRARNTAR